MDNYVLGLHEIGQGQAALVGGKGVRLAELSRIDGIRVPAGFCVTTSAYRKLVEAAAIGERLVRLSRLGQADRPEIRVLSGEIRRALEGTEFPGELTVAVTRSLAQLGEQAAYAVRSSATTEDLPEASFAGQQDTFLNVQGTEAILEHIARSYASLFTERAVTYRLQHDFVRNVEMAVVVQQMVFPVAAGVLFTADPVTSNRKITSIEATFGLGDALVSGHVNGDIYRVLGDEVVEREIATKHQVSVASTTGGTTEVAIAPEERARATLTDEQAVRLTRLGRQIETHFGHPQDIEWCMVDDSFQIVQSRPITTLFPLPAVSDGENHVYISVGHQQMMTDPMKPLGLSVWQLTTPRPMHEAGGRLFVDVSSDLASVSGRARLLELVGKSDPLVGGALVEILERTDFIPSLPEEDIGGAPARRAPVPIETNPNVVTELIERSQASIAALKRDIRGKSGSDLFDFILADIDELKRILFDPHSHQVFMSAMEATWWLNDSLQSWLGEKNVADTLTRSVLHNVTSEMGLALMDVADQVRMHRGVVSLLQHAEDDSFMDELGGLEGGQAVRDAIQAFLDDYGMRCVGEIDITRPRWSEQPLALVPLILSNVRNFGQGAGEQRFERGRREAWDKEQEVLAALRLLPEGERKADETKRMIDLVRTFIGYREYPKYGMISRYFVYKLALLDEADRLVQAGVLHERDDMFFLTFHEFHEVVRTNEVNDQLIDERKYAFRSYRTLTPPRVFTSDGEVVTGSYGAAGVPPGALVGLPVSAGTVEGRARVIMDVAEADLEAGDILVTAYTDPSWTPAFVGILGLVTEVGGLMTHGAVVAREYGVPAVVGVEHATALIHDGQRIRVNGTDGYVEVLP